MGVDWYACTRCEETFNDCGHYVHCDGCGIHWCSDECANEDGYEHKEWTDEKGEPWESNNCKYCREEDFTDAQLLKYVLRHVHAGRSGLINHYKDGLEIIVITNKEYENLLERDNMLSALEGAGVDNWCGYDDAMDFVDQWKKEDEE